MYGSFFASNRSVKIQIEVNFLSFSRVGTGRVKYASDRQPWNFVFPNIHALSTKILKTQLYLTKNLSFWSIKLHIRCMAVF